MARNYSLAVTAGVPSYTNILDIHDNAIPCQAGVNAVPPLRRTLNLGERRACRDPDSRRWPHQQSGCFQTFWTHAPHILGYSSGPCASGPTGSPHACGIERREPWNSENQMSWTDASTEVPPSRSEGGPLREGWDLWVGNGCVRPEVRTTRGIQVRPITMMRSVENWRQEGYRVCTDTRTRCQRGTKCGASSATSSASPMMNRSASTVELNLLAMRRSRPVSTDPFCDLFRLRL